MLALWDEDVKAGRPLSIIIPIVFYHGDRKWDAKPFAHYFDEVSPLLEQFIPRFTYHLTDLKNTPDQTILDFSAEHLLGSLMLIYKKIDDDEFVKTHFPDFFRFYENHPELKELFRIFATYFYHKTTLDKKEVAELSRKHLSQPLKSSVMTVYEQLIKEGKELGLEEGLKLGEAKGEAKLAKERAAFLTKQKTAIARLLMKGTLSIPEIAEAMEVPLQWVVEIRNELIAAEIFLTDEIKAYQIPE